MATKIFLHFLRNMKSQNLSTVEASEGKRHDKPITAMDLGSSLTVLPGTLSDS